MNLRVRLDEARLLFLNGKLEEAVQVLSAVLREDSSSVEAHRELARVRVAQGKEEWAKSLLHRAALLERSAQQSPAAQVDTTDLAYAKTLAAQRQSENPVFDPSGGHPKEEASQSLEGKLGDFATDKRNVLSLSDTTSKASRPDRLPEQADRPSLPVVRWKGRRRCADGDDSGMRPTEMTDDRANPSAAHPTSAPSQVVLDDSAEEAEEVFRFDDSVDADSDHDLWEADDLEVDDADLQYFDEIRDSNRIDSTASTGEFDWSDVDVNFDDDEEDYEDEIELEVREYERVERDSSARKNSNKKEYLDLYKRVEQIALQILIDTGRVGDPVTSRRELALLTRVLLENAAGTTRKALSASISARRITEILLEGFDVDDIVSAHECRQVWRQHSEFHLDLGGYRRGQWYQRTEEGKKTFSWYSALNFVSKFRAFESDQCRYFFCQLYEHWCSRARLQRTFPVFRSYVYYRLMPTGCELDWLPYFVFEESDGFDHETGWEDDPVRRAPIYRQIETMGLVPTVNCCPLDVPSLSRMENDKKGERNSD